METSNSEQKDKKLAICISDDLFLKGKIRAIPFPNHEIIYIKSLKKFDQLKPSFSELDGIDHIIVDLGTRNDNPIEIAKNVLAIFPDTKTTCFFSHVDIEAKKRAQENGFKKVVPRSVFFEDILKILQ